MQFRSRRKLTNFAITLGTRLGPVEAVILDLHADGARVRHDGRMFVPDDLVGLHLRGRDHRAAVVWAKDGEAGLHFERPLPPEALTLILRERRRSGPPKKARFLMS